jgi:hypothetical protein
MVADGGKSGLRACRGIFPIVMKIERRAVIDEVQRLVPAQQIRIAGGAVHVGHEGVEPHRGGRQFGVRGIARGRVEHHGAGQEVHAQVDAHAGVQQGADFGVGLVASQRGIDFDEHQLGHIESEGASDTTGDDFRGEGQRTLSRAGEFQDVETEVVGLHQRGEGSAFAERSDIAGGLHGAEH